MMDKLLPCPFCGGEVKIDMLDSENSRNVKIYSAVHCPKCHEWFFKGLSKEKTIAAWNRRAQPENKPLTLDEMNALNHEPIYILHMDGHGKWSMNGWHIATASSYRNHGRCDLEIDNGNTIIDMQNYGKTWLAYRSKPKEENAI